MAASRLLLVEDGTLTRLVTAERLSDDGFEVVANHHGDEARALLDDPDDFETRAFESATAQGQIDALIGRTVALAAIVNTLEKMVIAPAAPALDATPAAATGPVSVQTRLDAQTISLLRAAS